MRYFTHLMQRDRDISTRGRIQPFTFTYDDDRAPTDTHLLFRTTDAVNTLQFFLDRSCLRKEYFYDPIANILTEAVVATDYGVQFSDMPCVSVVTAVERSLRHGTTMRYVGPEGDYADGIGDQQAADVRICMLNTMYMEGPGEIPTTMDWVHRCFDAVVGDMTYVRQHLTPCTYSPRHVQLSLLGDLVAAAHRNVVITLTDTVQSYDLSRRLTALTPDNVPLQRQVPSLAFPELSAPLSGAPIAWADIVPDAMDISTVVFGTRARTQLMSLMLVDTISAPTWTTTTSIVDGLPGDTTFAYAPHLDLMPKACRDSAQRAARDLVAACTIAISTVHATLTRIDVIRTPHDELAVLGYVQDTVAVYAVLDLLYVALSSPSIAEIYS